MAYYIQIPFSFKIRTKIRNQSFQYLKQSSALCSVYTEANIKDAQYITEPNS